MTESLNMSMTEEELEMMREMMDIASGNLAVHKTLEAVQLEELTTLKYELHTAQENYLRVVKEREEFLQALREANGTIAKLMAVVRDQAAMITRLKNPGQDKEEGGYAQ